MPFTGPRTANVAFIITIAAAGALSAGEWHYGKAAVCSDCHTQHNSSGGQPMRTDNNPTPAQYLLRRGTALDLCLSCHDGSNPNAPDVVEPVNYVSESAAGAFPPTISAPSTAHHLNNPTAEVPPGGTTAMVLTCTTCHDPHGNANYRNLRPDPTRPDITLPLMTVSQTVIANGSNPALVYVASNIIYKAGMSAWCGTCHGASVPHTTDHPVDVAIFGAALAEYSKWTSVTLPRVPVNSPSDNTIPSQDDQVMCLSCHKAHGSPNPSTLIYADGATLDSTCQECHNQ